MNVLVVAAHPDDEVLGCGGAIAKHSQAGDLVQVLILAEGVTSRDAQRNKKYRQSELSALRQAAHQAAEILGVRAVTFADFPDNRLDSLDLLDVIKAIEHEIERQRPEVIYTHHAGDLNIDHQYVHQAVVTAARPIPGYSVNTLLFFETVSSTEWQVAGSVPMFAPNWFVDISDTLCKKLQALDAYQTELRAFPHSRSIQGIKHLAGWRGTQVGVEAAEAFIVGRHIHHHI